MSKMKGMSFSRGVGAVLFLLLATVAQAIPGQLTVSGRLTGPGVENLFQLDDYGTTVSVTRSAKVAFYASQTSSRELAADQTQADILLGDFTITFDPPLELTGLEDLWCAVWIDVDEDGLTDADKFDRRFQIGSVPFALSTKPLELFSVHGGYQTFAGANDGGTSVHCAPFFSPTAGVLFNRMMFQLETTLLPVTVTLGIYDEDGKLVADTGEISFPSVNYSGLLEVETPLTYLKPSKFYLTAFRYRGSINWAFCGTTLSEYLGDLSYTSSLTEIPAQIDLDQIVPGHRSNSIALRLSYVPVARTKEKDYKEKGTKIGRVRYIPCPPPLKKEVLRLDEE